jgi:hypothetical protein
LELNPTNGATVTSVSGTFAPDATPIISGYALWDFAPGNININQTIVAYNLANLSFAAQYTEQKFVDGQFYTGASALNDTQFAFDEGAASGDNIIVSTGTDLPEPTSISLLGLSGAVLLRRRSRRGVTG